MNFEVIRPQRNNGEFNDLVLALEIQHEKHGEVLSQAWHQETHK